MSLYRCNTCNWTVPADPIGVGLMLEHLRRCDPSQTSAPVDVEPHPSRSAPTAPSVPVLMADPVLDELTS